MIALDPNETFEVTVPKAGAFTFHYMTARQYAKYDRLHDQAIAESSYEKKIDLIEEAIGMILVKGPAEGKVGDYMTMPQLWDLMNAIPKESTLTEADKKKSASQSASAAAMTSAESAAQRAA